MSCTFTLVAVKVTVYPASHIFLMLTRLFLNVSILCPVSVPLGSPGRFMVANADDVNNSPDAVTITFVGAVMSMLVTVASGIKK